MLVFATSFRTCSAGTKWILISCALLLNLFNTVFAEAPATVMDAATVKSDKVFEKIQIEKIPELQPSALQARLEKYIILLLQEHHYQKVKFNATQFKLVFELYLDMIDPQKLYLLESDIDEIAKTKAIGQNPELSQAFALYNRLQHRMVARSHWVLEQLPALQDFTKNETMEVDRKNAKWAKNSIELDEAWRKRIKNEMLGLMLSDKTMEDARATLTRRYQTRQARALRITNQDVFQLYMNAITTSVDPHTNYFSPRLSKSFDIQMSLALEGIGAVLRMDEDTTKVVELVTGGPADSSRQIQPNDEIIGVAQGDQGEMEDVVGWRLDDVVEKIRGPRGTKVRLLISPANTSGPLKEVTIVRDRIELEKQAAQGGAIKTITRGETTYRLGVIKLPTFYLDFEAIRRGEKKYRSTSADVKAILERFKEQKVDGILLDLRQNGGGSLQEAIELTSQFIKQGPVVQVKDNSGKVKIEFSPGKKQIYDGPLLVLIDRFSASASEILAAALQDYGRAMIVGSTSFGKGTVQQINVLAQNESGSSDQLKFTTAKFYRINGGSTQHKGVEPDLVIPDFIDPKTFGESSEKNAAPWDQINPVAGYDVMKNVKNQLPELNKHHTQRMKTDPALLIYQEQVAEVKKQLDQTHISLKESVRRNEFNQRDAAALKRENGLREIYGLPKMTKEEFKEGAKTLMTDEQKANAPDPVLSEALQILTDYVQLQSSKSASAGKAANSAANGKD